MFVVKNSADLYLQDQGLLQSKDLPYGGPGCFGSLETAYVFSSKSQAVKASKGLLGPGRNSTVEKV